MKRSRSSRIRALRQLQSYLREDEEMPVDIVYYSRLEKKWFLENIKLSPDDIETAGYARLIGNLSWGEPYGLDTIPLARAMLKTRDKYHKSISNITVRRIRGLPGGKSSLTDEICLINKSTTNPLQMQRMAI